MVHSFKAVPVLVTGAGRGIGKRLAIGFAGKDARVGLLARSKAELDLCHLEIEHQGGAALRMRADVCDYEQVTASLERMRVQFGNPVQVLVCAAATLGPIGPFVDSSPKSWHEVVQTNLVGVLNACRAVLPQMIERRNGKIIVIAGVGGALPARPNFAVHSATKTAVVRFVESLAEEVAEHNVQVNCLSPGETYTHMTDQVLVAGVIDSLTNFVEHPEVVADRIERVAAVVGDPSRVLAGTDCGFDTSAGWGRVAEDVVWAKLSSLRDGARLASDRLFSHAR